MRLKQKDLQRILDGSQQDSTVKAKAATRPNAMNRTEQAYAALLASRVRAGEIARFDREPEGLRLADRCVYWPDFRVICLDGTVEFHEVKGRSGDKFHAREDAWIKLKVAAATHPMYKFLVVWPSKRGGWESQDV
jgi:hypothetical protein